MPKIEAETVKAHRAQMEDKLIDAAQTLLIDQDDRAFTAQAVAQHVGIARNSLYRYVDSIDDLRARVIARWLPTWIDAVDAAVATATNPRDKLLAYIDINLEYAHASSHGKLITIAQSLSPEYRATITSAHEQLAGMVTDWCARLDPDGYVLTAAFIQAILNTGFDQLARGGELSTIRKRCRSAILAIIDDRTNQ
ncbi:TetR/AcrR family transcriptional regulator [Stomatohabitans albus]|uniref:TetR/AcrR family transcriptional regulator n=1 Tax=Stomatohabitans albus TaxID=3110766 RepID=UPI00300D31D8